METQNHFCMYCEAVSNEGDRTAVHPSEWSYFALLVCAVAAAWKADHVLPLPLPKEPLQLMVLAAATVKRKCEFVNEEEEETEPVFKKRECPGLNWRQKMVDVISQDFPDSSLWEFISSSLAPQGKEDLLQLLQPEVQLKRARARGRRLAKLHTEMAALPKCAKHGTKLWFSALKNLQDIQYHLGQSRHSTILPWRDQYCLCGPARSYSDHNAYHCYYFNQGRLTVSYTEELDWDASHDHYWYPNPSVYGKCAPEPRSYYFFPHRHLKARSRIIHLPQIPYPL